MKKERKDDSFLKKPYYQGGEQALKEFISKNLKYPEHAIAHKIEGSIPIKYDINYRGEVSDVKILSSLGYGCDEEAIRVVKLLKFIVPKIPKNLKVVFHKNIAIHFSMKGKETIQTQPNIPAGITYQINFTPRPVVVVNAEAKKPSQNYQYKINL